MPYSFLRGKRTVQASFLPSTLFVGVGLLELNDTAQGGLDEALFYDLDVFKLWIYWGISHCVCISTFLLHIFWDISMTLPDRAMERAEKSALEISQGIFTGMTELHIRGIIYGQIAEAVEEAIAERGKLFQENVAKFPEELKQAKAEERERCAKLIEEWKVWTPDHIVALTKRIRDLHHATQ